MSKLRIDPEVLATIQAACKRRSAELEAATDAATLSAPPTLAVPSEIALSGSEEQAQRFAAAILEMPDNVRRFFEPEDPVPPRHWESDQDRAQRERLTALGGWCG